MYIMFICFNVIPISIFYIYFNILCFSKYCVVKEQSLKSVSLLKTLFNLDLLSHIQYFTLFFLKNMQSLLLKYVFCVCAKTNPFKLSLSLCLRPQNGSMILLQQEEGEVQKGWLLLEEEERWENHAGGSHEAQSAGVEVRGCSLLVTRYNHKLSWKTSWKHKLSTMRFCVRLA